MTDLQEIKKELREIKRLLSDRPSATWVTARLFMSRTGVDKYQLRRMRENGTVKMKESKTGARLYLLDAVLITS